MQVRLCDKCKKPIQEEKANRLHVYNYIVRSIKGRKVAHPKRDDFDLCNKCREELIKWLK